MNTMFTDVVFIRSEIILITSFLTTSYIYMIASKTKNSFLKILYILLSSILITTLCTYLKMQSFQYYVIIYLCLSIISLTILNYKQILFAISNSFLAIGIGNCIEFISVIILGTLFYALGFNSINIFTELCASLFQFILCILLMKIKRLQNGFVFIKEKKNFWITLIIAGPIIVFTSFLKQNTSDTFLTIIAFGIIISLVGLFIAIHSAFIHYYRKRIKLRAEEYSKIELAEKQEEIEKLTNENASLSSIIHLDNHLINMLEVTLENYKNDNSVNDLLILTKQRNEYVNSKIINEKLLPTTGNTEIDSAISDMYIKAASRGIDFTLNVDCDINYLIHNIIEQADFEELIRSCITNSIVDIESNPDAIGKIIIKISQPNDIYEFTIMDNGVTNDNNTKAISEIIDKSNAGIKTNTFDNNDSFTKSLTIRFDGLKNIN